MPDTEFRPLWMQLQWRQCLQIDMQSVLARPWPVTSQVAPFYAQRSQSLRPQLCMQLTPLEEPVAWAVRTICNTGWCLQPMAELRILLMWALCVPGDVRLPENFFRSYPNNHLEPWWSQVTDLERARRYDNFESACHTASQIWKIVALLPCQKAFRIRVPNVTAIGSSVNRAYFAFHAWRSTRPVAGRTALYCDNRRPVGDRQG